MTQCILIQVGQCGNQIGGRFWDLALRETLFYKKEANFDESTSSFFRNVDSSGNELRNDTRHVYPIQRLKARAVLVDMEEGVISEMMRGPLGSLFDHNQLISSVSGSGNNWATGHCGYGHKYREQLTDVVRRAAESCDALQCFFILHSLGGGTGSGLGTYILDMLADEFPDVYRFVAAVFPSEDDDVITSPYNTVLATRLLTERADCVMPIENQALMDLVKRLQARLEKAAPPASKPRATAAAEAAGTLASNTGSLQGDSGQSRPFDAMNNIVANLILNLTASSRFEGSLNVDLNEITMNLVPYPRLHYLVASQAPIVNSLADPSAAQLPTLKRLESVFHEALAPTSRLVRASNTRDELLLACALLARGSMVELSDVRRNVQRLQGERQHRFVHWNPDGWKIGLCSVPPALSSAPATSSNFCSLLALANSTGVRHTFANINERFERLYRRRAHLHHYLNVDGFERSLFEQSADSVTQLIADYRALEQPLDSH